LLPFLASAKDAFGLKMDTLLRMQTSYDIAQARKAANKIKVKRYTARA